MSDTMLIRYKFFASIKELAGTSGMDLEITTPCTLADALKQLSIRVPQIKDRIEHCLISLNHDYVDLDVQLKNGDEIGVFPPVSGGSPYPSLTIVTHEKIDLNELARQIQDPSTGAAVIFCGFVRGQSPGTPHPLTSKLEYEAYDPMAQKMMLQICDEIRQKWPAVHGIFLVQRIGTLAPEETTTAIGVTTGHRDEGGFEAARYGIDRLKEIVPVWKKEVGPGGATWVEGSHHTENG